MYTIIMNSDKSLTKTIVRTIYKGENLVDTIVFLIPKIYGDVNLAQLEVELTYTDPQSGDHAEPLRLIDTDYKNDWLRFHLPVDTKLTQYSGDIIIRLQFSDVSKDGANRSVVLLTGTTKVTIRDPKGSSSGDRPFEGNVYINTEFPNVGSEQTIYINKLTKEICIWDKAIAQYIPVANYLTELADEDVEALFND